MHNLHDTASASPGEGAAPQGFAYLRYLRPQLVRAERRYRLPGDGIAWMHDLIVLFPPEAQASAVGERGCHHACWYQRDFMRQPGGPCVLLHVGAVDPHHLAKPRGKFDKKQTGQPGTWGYARVGNEAVFFDLYQRLMSVVNTAQMLSGFCHTQFADTFQEANGLLTADRTPKAALELLSAATRNIRLN